MEKCHCECGCQCERAETAKPEIDWEQRRWDLATDLFKHMRRLNDFSELTDAEDAVREADALIARYMGETK